MMSKIIVAVAVVAVLLGLGFYTKTPSVVAGVWGETKVQCLPDGHKNATIHKHAKLTIVVDSVPELIPSNIGDVPECMAEVHTHDASGKVHIEGVEEKTITLADFFAVWGKSIERDGYVVRASVGGVAHESPETIVLDDALDVVLMYTAISREQQ